MNQQTVTGNLYRQDYTLRFSIEHGPVIKLGNTVVTNPKKMYRREGDTVTFDSNEGYAMLDRELFEEFDELLEEDISVTVYQEGSEFYLQSYFDNEPYNYSVFYNGSIYRVTPALADSDPFIGRGDTEADLTNRIKNVHTEEARLLTAEETTEIIEDGAVPVLKVD
jgi:hypothetical protein